MVRYRRLPTTGPVFITIVTAGRRRWLTQAQALEAYEALWEKKLIEAGWKWIAWVLMPDHLHWLIEPVGEPMLSYSLLVKYFKESMTRALQPGQPLWQPRFWEHCIRDDLDRQRHFDYIHWNPIKHGWARHPEAWSHGSFQHYVSQRWYPSEWKGAEDVVIKGDIEAE